MELRHLRYFVAIAEALNLTAAAEQTLHIAQPSLSRQMRDLETELGVTLMLRRARGIELTPAGRTFLEHARLVLLQIEMAGEAARRAADPAKASFAIGFLTGYEIAWLAPIMHSLQHELPKLKIAISSKESPELATSLVRGTLDVALMRPERNMPTLAYTPLQTEPLVVVMGRDHRLAAVDSVDPHELTRAIRVGVPSTTAPVLRDVTDAYAARLGIDLTPHHLAENVAQAFSLVASTGGVALLPSYVVHLMPASVVDRRLTDAPTIDLVLGYTASRNSALVHSLISTLGTVADTSVRAARWPD